MRSALFPVAGIVLSSSHKKNEPHPFSKIGDEYECKAGRGRV